MVEQTNQTNNHHLENIYNIFVLILCVRTSDKRGLKSAVRSLHATKSCHVNWPSSTVKLKRITVDVSSVSPSSFGPTNNNYLRYSTEPNKMIAKRAPSFHWRWDADGIVYQRGRGMNAIHWERDGVSCCIAWIFSWYNLRITQVK